MIITAMDDIQKKIQEELAALQNSKVAKKTDAQLANYDNMSGQTYSAEWYAKQADAQERRKKSGWNKKMVGNKNSAGNQNRKGMTNTIESNIKRSEALKGIVRDNLRGVPKPKVTCPHCGKEGGKPQMIQYHFDKCKMK